MADTPPLTAGERSSRDLLSGLRASRYRPAGWVSLLERSFARAAATPSARPALARQARRWGIAGAAATLAQTTAATLAADPAALARDRRSASAAR